MRQTWACHGLAAFGCRSAAGVGIAGCSCCVVFGGRRLLLERKVELRQGCSRGWHGLRGEGASPQRAACDVTLHPRLHVAMDPLQFHSPYGCAAMGSWAEESTDPSVLPPAFTRANLPALMQSMGRLVEFIPRLHQANAGADLPWPCTFTLPFTPPPPPRSCTNIKAA